MRSIDGYLLTASSRAALPCAQLILCAGRRRTLARAEKFSSLRKTAAANAYRRAAICRTNLGRGRRPLGVRGGLHCQSQSAAMWAAEPSRSQESNCACSLSCWPRWRGTTKKRQAISGRPVWPGNHTSARKSQEPEEGHRFLKVEVVRDSGVERRRSCLQQPLGGTMQADLAGKRRRGRTGEADDVQRRLGVFARGGQ